MLSIFLRDCIKSTASSSIWRCGSPCPQQHLVLEFVSYSLILFLMSISASIGEVEHFFKYVMVT